MPVTSEWDERGFTRLTFNGTPPALPELIAWYKSIGDIAQISRLLVDMRAARGPMPKYPDIRDTVGAFEGPAARERRRAVLVSNDLQFGIARMFQAMVSGQMEVFRDEPSAIGWLLGSAK